MQEREEREEREEMGDCLPVTRGVLAASHQRSPCDSHTLLRRCEPRLLPVSNVIRQRDARPGNPETSFPKTPPPVRQWQQAYPQ